ncbi:Alpha/Beta hydrolase protein [Aspergillus karnatakaensis]|uniref:alpha/beta hydrolase n=1 Tax=Aspergillus karnatakaensis TaxID=1810916 RepID=UPI003CCD39C4
MSSHKFDPEFYAAMKETLEGPSAQIKDIYDIRKLNEDLLPAISSAYPVAKGIQQELFSAKSYDGAKVDITRFASESALKSSTPLPAVIFIHGGAMVSGSPAMYAQSTSYLAEQLGYPVFSVDYRVAPEHSPTVSMEDCYAAVAWVSQNAGSLNVDPAKLTVMGDSAGGLHSACVALNARDRKLSPPLAKQVLIYPTLDDRVPSTKNDPRGDLLLWREEYSVITWNAYLGEGHAEKDSAELPNNSVPARVEDLSGLPSTYMDIGTLDLFLEENMTYASRLVKAGVEVELHVQPGLPHGWEGAGPIGWFKAAMQSRVDAIKRGF